ncbi:MAG TPA: hypothetical protein VK797_06005 [Tepidisphaeraceae bacterium]|nr:hypothetical protein [Tepidisphaeraceae bacterium]
MKLIVQMMTAVACLCAVATSQTTAQSDVRKFELTAVAPPAPALKYQLLFDDQSARRPGNAAILYLDSILLMGPDAKQKAEQALNAFDANDMKTFDSLAAALDTAPLFEELDLAARREQCDWQPPFREMGVRTLLPHLEPLVNGIARIIKVKTLRQIRDGDVDGALATLRLGYELSNKVGHEPILISGLVSLRMTRMMNDCLIQLIQRPDARNLYWALTEFPPRQVVLRNSFDGERLASATASIPDLARFEAGEQLSAGQWRDVFRDLDETNVTEEGQHKHIDPLAQTSADVLRQAQQAYAQAHRATADQAARTDPAIVLGEYYFREYQIAYDDMSKLRGLPYPLLLAKSKEYGDSAEKLVAAQPANPFLYRLPTIYRAVLNFARVDRQLAALTAAEAIRSYAAAHSGKLPQRLQDVSETPVPANPATGAPFDYSVRAEAATLSDSHLEMPLTYTITIRK